jgi:uncharacterized membrane protein YfcA
MQDPAALLLFSGIVLLAAATQTLTGFGFSLVGLALMGLWMDLREAVLLIVPAGLAQNIFLFLRLRKNFSWSGLVPLMIACLVGVPLGTWFLLNAPVRGLAVTMAVIMIATALHRIWLDRRSTVVVWHPVKAGVPCGLLSGILAGAFGAGGPPVVSYLLNRPVGRFQFVASIQVIAGLCSVLRLWQFGHAGRYGAQHLPLVLSSVAASILGVLIGTKILTAASDKVIRHAIIGFLLAGGTYYLART